MTVNNRNLVAILANPSETSGARTWARVNAARAVLGFDTVSVANIFPLATRRTTDISAVGKTADHWNYARISLQEELRAASAVLLAYGTSEPTGAARMHHRDQIKWLRDEIAEMKMPAYIFGDGTRHPSRWQRYTSRNYPSIPFSDAVPLSLRLAHWTRS